jgi:hypothetical protein
MKGARKNRMMFLRAPPSSGAAAGAFAGGEDFAKGGHGELLFFV